MFRRAWFCYAVALLATVAACVLWLVVFSELRDSPSRSRDPVVPAFTAVTSSPVVLSHAVPPAPPRSDREACVNGQVWQYFDREQRWVKLPASARCDPLKPR